MSKLFITAAILLFRVAAFSQFLDDKDIYSIIVKKERDAVNIHVNILNENGYDTRLVSYQYGNNPIIYAYFISPDGNKIGTYIFEKNEGYEILFIKLPTDYIIDKYYQLINKRT